jgi:hypothetical protein
MSVEIERDKIIHEMEVLLRLNQCEYNCTWLESLIRVKNILIDRLATSEEKVKQLSAELKIAERQIKELIRKIK